MAKVTEKLKLTLPSPEDRIDIDVLNGNYETLENQIYTNLIKKKTSISEKSSFGEVIPPYVTITNTNLDVVNVTVGEEKVTVPAASTIAVAIKEKKELSIDTDGVIAVEYFISNERYASEQSGSAVDSELSEASENPVQNKVITAKFKEYYNSEEVDELIDGIGTPEDVYTKTETDDLLSAKANKSDTYTKTETDNKITEKVSEIVAGAPEDFDTLKEMSDWLIEHEDSAAAMNSDIQKNKTDISSLNTEIVKKVDKVIGKSLIADSEITRLAGVDNYDDTSVNAQIADIYNRCGGGKNICDFKNTKVTSSYGLTYTKTDESLIITESNKAYARAAFNLSMLPKGRYNVSFMVSDLECESNTAKVLISRDADGTDAIGTSVAISDNIKYTFGFNVTSTTQNNYIIFYGNYSGTIYNNKLSISEIMISPEKIKNDTYVPYIPTNEKLYEQINALTARIAALEGTATTE